MAVTRGNEIRSSNNGGGDDLVIVRVISHNAG